MAIRNSQINKSVRIFIDTPMFAIGGVESFSINLALSLQKLGLDISLIESRSNRYVDHKMSKEAIDSISKKVPIITRSEYFEEITKNTSYKNITVTSWNIEFIEELADLYITNKLSKKNNKVIGYVHNEASQYYDTVLIYESIFDSIICVSKKSFNFLQQTTPTFKNKLIYRPCPTSIHITDFQEKVYSKSNQKIMLSFIGRLDDTHKGIFRIPKILSLLKQKEVDFFIKIIGDGQDKKELIELLKDFKGCYSFHFANNQTEVKRLIEDIDIIILPSNYEGGPLVIYEAMACGIIPIVNRVGNMPSLIKAEKNGFIFSIDDNSGFSNAIMKLSENREQLGRLGKEAYNTVKSLGYFQEDYNKFFVDLIDELLSNPNFISHEFKKDIQTKKKNKIVNIEGWIENTIPFDIIKRYNIKSYINLAKKSQNQEITQLEYYIRENNDIHEHYDHVYEKMPVWWKKLGSVIRKIKKL